MRIAVTVSRPFLKSERTARVSVPSAAVAPTVSDVIRSIHEMLSLEQWIPRSVRAGDLGLETVDGQVLFNRDSAGVLKSDGPGILHVRLICKAPQPRRSAAASAPTTQVEKVCAACGQALQKSQFSAHQWRGRGRGECMPCVEARVERSRKERKAADPILALVSES